MKSKIQRGFVIVCVTVFVSAFSIYLFTYSTYEEKEDLSYKKVFQANYKIFALNLPNTIEFAGEKVPMNLIDVREKLDRELHVNTYWQSNTLLFIKRSNRWFPIIEKILLEENVPNDFKYLALIESGLTQVVSPAGAAGFWQIMKKTAPEFGLEVTSEVDERYHIEKSTHAACLYLKEAKEKFGSWTLAAASYNIGQSGLQRQLNKQEVNSYYDLLLNSETSRYLFRILAAKHILSNANQFGFNFRPKDLYPAITYKTIVTDSSISSFTEFAAQNGINYKVLKYLNPWLRSKELNNSKRKNYEIKIPDEKFINQLQTQPPLTELDTSKNKN
jgi:membrane-bound lytic murein transglycosylase D